MNLRPFLLLTVATVCLAAAPAAAQEKSAKKFASSSLPHRLSFSYGNALGVQGSNGASSLFPGISYTAVDPMGSFNLDYIYMFPGTRWGFGMGASLMQLNTQPFFGLNYSVPHLMLSVAPQVQFTYLRSGLVELYGTASVGVMMSVTKDDALYGLAWQVNPIALRVGTDRIAGFLTAGFGSRGILGIGVQVGL